MQASAVCISVDKALANSKPSLHGDDGMKAIFDEAKKKARESVKGSVLARLKCNILAVHLELLCGALCGNKGPAVTHLDPLCLPTHQILGIAPYACNALDSRHTLFINPVSKSTLQSLQTTLSSETYI